MKWVVIGAGATGGFFGGQLATHGKDVTFVARGHNLEALQSRGLQVYSATGLTSTRVHVVNQPAQAETADLILVTVKCYDLATAIEEIAPIVRSNTRILCIQNGVDAPGMAARRYGPARVLGGLTRIEAVLLAPGVVGHFSSFAKFVFGAWQRPNGTFEQEVVAELRDAEIDCELAEDAQRSLWDKMLTLCPLAATTSITRCTLGEILACPESRALHIGAIEEVCLAAKSAGIDLGSDAAERAFKWHTSLLPTTRASMARDLEAGRRLELDQLSGTVVRLGREAGFATPVHSMVYAALKPAALAALEKYRLTSQRPPYFGEYLVQAGRITQEQLISVLRLLQLEQNRGEPLRVGDALVRLGLVTRATIEGLKEHYDELLSERGRTVS